MDFTSEIGDQIGNAYANQTVKPQQTDPKRMKWIERNA